MKKRSLILLGCILLVSSVLGQNAGINVADYQLEIYPVEGIVIDGKLDEPAWKGTNLIKDFWVQNPVDSIRAPVQTEVRMGYDDRFIYIGAICYDDKDLIVQTLKRDVFGGSDVFTVTIDPFGEQSNGFGFAVNALGAQTESLVSPNGADLSWDNKWFSATSLQEDAWLVEMAIPYTTLRFNADQKYWNIQFVRVDPGLNQEHVWAPVPRQFASIDLGYFGRLVFADAPKKTGGNIALIPYVTARWTEDYSRDNTGGEFEVGGDAKVAITPSLNLDLTVNPDFSQVEVDRQVTNLSRFNIFFPERRQFFIENSDIFNGFGMFADAPFYSRRIGLNPGGGTVPIRFGGRLSGNLTDKLRVGLLNMQTAKTDEQAAQNYSAAVFQQRFWKRSFLKGIFLNRQAFDDGKSVALDYGRNLGGELRMSTPDGKWEGHGGYLHSLKNGLTKKNGHLYGGFDYRGQNFRTFLYGQHIGTNYFADLGFNGRLYNFDPDRNEIVRLGYTHFANMVNYWYYPEKENGKVNVHWSGIENFVYINDDTGLNEWYTRFRHFFFFKNTSELRFRLNYNYVDLVFPFAISDPPLPKGAYDMWEFNVQFNTDRRKLLTTEWFIVYGQFFNGTKLTSRGSVSYRIQPWASFTLGIDQNNIWLPAPYGNVDFTLATARAEINFSTELFWTTFLQYNTQADNFNVNSRLQWRFAPMSDLFLVYTDNYTVLNVFGPKNRSLSLKLNYWLNI